MLPNFPSTKQKLIQLCEAYVDKKIREYFGILKEIQPYRHYEGNRYTTHHENGSETESEYQKPLGSFSIDNDEVPGLVTWEKITAKLDVAARDMANQTEKHFIKVLESQTKNRGLELDDGRFDKESFFEMLDSMSIEFDGQNNPIMPTFLVHPSMKDSFEKQLEEWQNGPEFKERFELLIQRKREEWRDRKNSRRLVD